MHGEDPVLAPRTGAGVAVGGPRKHHPRLRRQQTGTRSMSGK